MKGDCPFSLWRRADRPNFYVQFKNEKTGTYMKPICTGQASRADAMKTAWKWYNEGIPKKSGATVKAHTIADMVYKTDMTQADAETLLDALKQKGLIKSAVLTGTRQDRDFIAFLRDFWDFDNSPYVRERLRKEHGIHRKYCYSQNNAVTNYWAPFFKGRLLGTLTKADSEAFIDYLDTIRMGKAERPLAGSSKNHIIKAGTVALKWAYNKELIDTDLSAGIVYYSGKAKERQILTPEMAKAVFAISWNNEKARLAAMLACVTGLRAGEILALRGVDIGADCLYIRHSFNTFDLLKTTKNNETRVVQVPFPGLMRGIIDLAHSNPHGEGADGFVFYSDTLPETPLDEKVLVKSLRRGLRDIGLSAPERLKYTFHGFRHYFTAYMKGRIEDRLLKLQTGHKTDSMLAHYSAHDIDGQAAMVQAAQIKVFGGLLPAAKKTGA
jgi:integrase